MADEAARINDITARFREAGFELRLYESMSGAWDAIWHPHGQGSGMVGTVDAAARTTTGATLLEAAESALAELERTGAGGREATQ